MPSTVGVIVNPIAGKDIRRLVTAASHTSDSSKVDVVRRAVIAALEIGAERVLVAPDPHNLGRRATSDLGNRVHVVDTPVHGSREDTVGAAMRMWKEDVGALVVLGGDGTCRDVALGWPDAPMIAISTGTNNVFPSPVDATSAGTAAALFARGLAGRGSCRRSKRVTTTITDAGRVVDDLALVDLALIDASFVGARAVLDPSAVRVVVASMASPASTGLASIAGRVHPVGRWEPGGVLVRLGPGGRPIRVPLGPGSFTTVEVLDVAPLADGEVVHLQGPGVLAFDGERDRRIGPSVTVAATVEAEGPLLIDVEQTLLDAARAGLFDIDPTRLRQREGHDGH
jgi:hypothetical protein